MVCQAASQTRFRALKHESGIAGNSTIIVRVIACFQPLRECQAEYFRHLLKPVTVSFVTNSSRVEIVFSSGDCSDKMKEDCGTWIPNLQLGWQSPNLNPLDVGKLGGVSAAMNPGVNMISAYETMPAFASSALQPRMQLGCSSDPRGWFYCLPRFRQEFTPAPSFTVEGKTPVDHVKGFGDKIAPFGESSSPRKQFLVIDKTAGQKTVVYSSRFGSPCECLASWHSKLHGGNNWRVASSAKKTKKRKLLDGYCEDIQLTDTASSQNMNKSSATCDDSESRCSSNNNGGSLSSNKKMKKEKIQDVLSILQSIIPGGKDKGPVMLLDDAIRSLKSLKQKAQAFGLDAL
ncbi:hypothetical protein DEO72_LG11g2975 [Vigna unguiculata]|uniref:Uncharacterized protein n=1 Tax=Vigna unguiculata TaxID=3917 RepID=A0A4D6NSM6_VIGUN|nr:hypothetical protein DEO72_LG11g2975 [Vigna unguiculata]